MSQGSYNVPTGGSVSMVSFAALMNAAYDALATQNSGASQPANGPGNAALEFQAWFDTTSVNFPVFRFFDGVNWDRVGTLDVVNSNWLPQLGGGTVTLPSAATVNIGASPQTIITISGSATISSFGSTGQVGEMKLVYASGAFAITNSGAIVCPNGLSINVRVGDTFFVGCLGSGNWQIFGYVRPSTKDIFLNIEDFGGKGDGSTDNTPALNSALAALGTRGGTIYFPAASSFYQFNSGITFNVPVSAPFSVSIIGAGQDAVELRWPNASGGITINYNGVNSSAHVRDLTLATGTTTGGDAIKLNLSASLANPALTAMSDLTRVTMRGSDGYGQTNYWTNDVNVANVSNINFDGVEMCGSSGALGNAVKLLGLPGSSTYGVQYNFDKCTFVNLATGITYGSFVQGVTVDQCNFTAVTQCIVSPAAQTGTLAQLSVTNSQFNPTGASAKGIITNTAIFNVQFSNCLFLFSQNNVDAINLAANNHFNIVGNEIANLTGATSVNGIIVGPSSASGSGVISGNDILNCTNGVQVQTGALATSIVDNTITGGAGTTPIVIQASVAGLTVQNNNLVGPGTNISNSSTSQTNSIINNLGYNPVGPSAITVGASPFIYTAGPSPETVYIIGGTVSGVNVDKNGGAFVAGSGASGQSNVSIPLGPNEQVKVTYTGLPVMNKMVH